MLVPPSVCCHSKYNIPNTAWYTWLSSLQARTCYTEKIFLLSRSVYEKKYMIKLSYKLQTTNSSTHIFDGNKKRIHVDNFRMLRRKQIQNILPVPAKSIDIYLDTTTFAYQSESTFKSVPDRLSMLLVSVINYV